TLTWDHSPPFVLARDPSSAKYLNYSDMSRALIKSGTLFPNHSRDGVSGGTLFATLWKREIAAVLWPRAWEAPWDVTPTIGISLKLGYEYLRPVDGLWVPYNPPLHQATHLRDHDMLVIHPNDRERFGI